MIYRWYLAKRAYLSRPAKPTNLEMTFIYFSFAALWFSKLL